MSKAASSGRAIMPSGAVYWVGEEAGRQQGVTDKGRDKRKEWLGSRSCKSGLVQWS